MKKRTLLLASILVAGALAYARLWAGPKIYLAPDNHTDFIWTASEASYTGTSGIFAKTLDHYLSQIDADLLPTSPIKDKPELQSHFSTDGSLWLWTYQKNRTAAQFQKLISRIKDGHISSTMSPLVLTYGGQTAEGVLRGMYYPGRLERANNFRFTLAQAMENSTLPYGLGALWAGAGVKYNWQGVCNCGGGSRTDPPNPGNRGREIYHWTGPDGSSLLTKWYSYSGSTTALGGYGEARQSGPTGVFQNPLNPNSSVDDATDKANTSPFNIAGVFGYGWDDADMVNHYDDLQTFAQHDATVTPASTRTVTVSNEEDFFKDFEATYGSSPSLPTFGASFGNQWDVFCTTMAEVSAHVKRSVEKLRSAEALATLVSLKNPSFLASRIAARDQAFMDIGLYFEHDFSANGPASPQPNGTTRAAWQKRLALNEIDPYVNALQSDAITALGAMIPKAANSRFFVFNPLGHTRSDVADFAYPVGAVPIHVLDVSNTNAEVPSQIVTIGGARYVRIQAPNVPAVGYKVFEVQPGPCGVCGSNIGNPSAGVLNNGTYSVTVSSTGAITSVLDSARSKEFVNGTINDLGGTGGTLSVENVGPVSATILAHVTTSTPLKHDTRVTLFLGSDRIEVKNEITQNPGQAGWSWGYNFNLTSPDVHHEEVGAIAHARKQSGGGDYADNNAVYDWLSLNHFVDMTGSGSVGITLSNADAFFFRLGNSTSGILDTTAPSVKILGGLPFDADLIPNQNGDTYFMQRFALRTHDAYDGVAAMKFALEHQNPLVTGSVTGTSGYPADHYSFVTISDPNVVLWALKPADDGIDRGVVARLWNLGGASSSFSASIAPGVASAEKTTHVETSLGAATVSGGALQGTAAAQQIVTYQLHPVGGVTGGGTLHFSAANYSVTEGGTATITVKRDGPTAAPVSVDYAVSLGTALESDLAIPTATGTLSFAKGVASRTFTVPTVSNTIVDGNRTGLLRLENPGGGAELATDTTAVLTIVDNDVGGKIQFSASAFTVHEGDATALVKISRTGGVASGAAVQFTASGGTATPGVDYDEVLSQNVSFTAGQTSQTVTVTMHDGPVEGNPTIALSLAGGAGGATLGTRTAAVLTILKNNPVVQFSAANFTASESAKTAIVTVKRLGPTTDTVTVNYALTDGTAHAPADYDATPGVVTFAKGITSRTFSVPLVNDAAHEPNRIVNLSLPAVQDIENPGQAALGQQSTAVLTINDTDSTPKLQFGASAYSVSDTAGTANVVVKRLGETGSTVTVHYATSDGTAQSPTNYQAASGDLTFNAGEVSKTIPVTIHDAVTRNLTLSLALSSPADADPRAVAILGNPSTAVVTILSKDPLLQFSAATYKVGEIGPKATITVKRSGVTTSQVFVDYATSDGSATQGQDYTTSSGTLTFDPGVVSRTFDVLVADSAMLEPDQTVNLTLTNATAPAALGSLSTAVLTLVTDDPKVQFSGASYSVAEASSKATITVRRTGPTTRDVMVPVAASDGSALVGVNYGAPSPSTLDFAKGVVSRTFTIPILNETADEPPPLTVNLSLGTPLAGQGLLGSPSAATLTISDNDVAGTLQFTVSDYSVGEAGASGTAVVTATRSGGKASGVSVDYATSGGSAVIGTNYQSSSGTLAFAEGQTTASFTVDVLDDGVHTGNLTVDVQLGNVTGGAVLGARTTATLWIVDAE